MAIDAEVTLDYFRGTLPNCVKCAKPFDWLNVLTALIEQGDPFYQALALAGARWTVTQITLRPNTNFQLDLADHGVDRDARVLFVSYTPNSGGGLFPLQWHGNVPDRVPRMKSILVPIEFTPAPVSATLVSVFVAWVPANLNAEPWSEFLRALKAHVEADYEAAVVPASAAVEAAVWQLIHAIVDRYASRASLDGFESQTSFDDVLNVLLPAFAGVLDEPRMSDELRGRANRLRKLRNELAHRGRPKMPITQQESAGVLAGALLCHRYCYLVTADLHARAHEAVEG